MAIATGAAQKLHAREYETIYILRSDVDADAADKVQHRVAEVVEREHGKLVKVEAWGRRKLAYPVAKQRKGVYVYIKYVGAGGLVTELERNLKLQDAVVKYQTVTTRDNVDVGAVAIDGACLRAKAQADPALGFVLLSKVSAELLNRLQATRLRLLDLYGSPHDS